MMSSAKDGGGDSPHTLRTQYSRAISAFVRRKEETKERRNEGTKERRNEGTKERRNEGTKERRNEGTKDLHGNAKHARNSSATHSIALWIGQLQQMLPQPLGFRQTHDGCLGFVLIEKVQ